MQVWLSHNNANLASNLLALQTVNNANKAVFNCSS